MKVVGIDFTSSPKKSKPLTCAVCHFDDAVLRMKELIKWPSFDGFDFFLQSDGPWVAGIDFPFGQARKFVENIGWPASWQEYVLMVGEMQRPEFRAQLDAYREHRTFGDKEHRRQTDVDAGSISPQKLYGVPVGLMFYEGAPRLVRNGVTVPGLCNGNPNRIVVEAYPGVLARRLIGRRSYKQDNPGKQTADQLEARQDLLKGILDGACARDFGFMVEASNDLCQDPSGDSLDALVCAMQAAWSWKKREDGFGVPSDLDALEGWIADPVIASIRR
jgi:hypothetical protein